MKKFEEWYNIVNAILDNRPKEPKNYRTDEDMAGMQKATSATNILKERTSKTFDKPEYYWNDKILPLTHYVHMILQNKNRLLYLHKAEVAENINLEEIHPKKLARILTQLDTTLILNITPDDLIYYNGNEKYKSVRIAHLLNKNKGMTNYIADVLQDSRYQPYFIKVMKYLKRHNNYNSIECICKAFQRHELDRNVIDKITCNFSNYYESKQYIDTLHTQNDVFMYPFNLFIKEVIDSNRNKENQDASFRFCRLVEMLVKLQNKYKIVRKTNKKIQHFLYAKFYIYLDAFVVEKDDALYDMFYLFL